MTSPYQHIACCVDDSPASVRALAETRALAAEVGARVSVVHAFEMPVLYPEAAMAAPPITDWLGDAERWLEGLTQGDEEPVLLEGHAASAVCAWAENERPDLLVAASHRGFVERIFLGSFAAHLATHSPVDVLLVRRPEVEDDESGAD